MGTGSGGTFSFSAHATRLSGAIILGMTRVDVS